MDLDLLGGEGSWHEHLETGCRKVFINCVHAFKLQPTNQRGPLH
jgi:hypothetical protein